MNGARDSKKRGVQAAQKICPHCDSRFPEDQEKCPFCGAQYWESGSVSGDSAPEQENEAQGCLSMIVLHFFLAFFLFVLFILMGFVINLFVHFEEKQIMVVWIAIALLLAAALSTLFGKVRNKGKRVQKNERQ